MKKVLALFSLVICLACSATLEVSTTDNYEAVALPDGSYVYVNQHSTISYREDFNPRLVYLKGEAFFEVVSSETTFTVSTAQGDIEVLGTEFNVKTTSKEVAVDVKKGLVELKTTYNRSTVKKGAKAVYKEGEEAVRQVKSNREYRKWLRSLKKEFKSMGRELKPVLKGIGNEFKKVGKQLGDGLKD